MNAFLYFFLAIILFALALFFTIGALVESDNDNRLKPIKLGISAIILWGSLFGMWNHYIVTDNYIGLGYGPISSNTPDYDLYPHGLNNRYFAEQIELFSLSNNKKCEVSTKRIDNGCDLNIQVCTRYTTENMSKISEILRSGTAPDGAIDGSIVDSRQIDVSLECGEGEEKAR